MDLLCLARCNTCVTNLPHLFGAAVKLGFCAYTAPFIGFTRHALKCSPFPVSCDRYPAAIFLGLTSLGKADEQASGKLHLVGTTRNKWVGYTCFSTAVPCVRWENQFYSEIARQISCSCATRLRVASLCPRKAPTLGRKLRWFEGAGQRS